ncbi:MAG: MBL fold metallo-hydrolase [Fuerstiella sp.]|nr:MBL fold metallo-hydrolase [Fuerstiella sp.]
MKVIAVLTSAVVCVFGVSASSATADVTISVNHGPVNGVLLETGGHRLAVYGWTLGAASGIDHLLLAHGRRDVVWKAMPLIKSGAKVIAPNRERFGLEKPEDFWNEFTTGRFHDYGQQSTKILPARIPVDRWVNDGDTIEWQGLAFRAIETPGYTRGSVSWLTEVDDTKIAFTGDLIYGDGQILDLYSFQDAIPDAQIRGYHGYGSRLADLVTSLQRIAAEKPDQIIPARGPVIHDPQKAIELLIHRVQELYRNYLSTNALHWYFKEDRMRLCGERVLGKDADVELMPYSHHEQTPSWVFENGTSRLLISDSGNAFLLDCGYQRIIDEVKQLITQGVIKKVEGIFVTHFHDDHADMVQVAAETLQCPVYAMSEYADLLAKPEAYHLPAMTANPIRDIKILQDGHQLKWHEFQFTFHFYPGQTWYHGALFARKAEQKPIFFIGDSFAPSGLDDYCVLNRNLVHEDSGYLLCLKKLRAIDEPFWLVNEHIPFVFSFTDDELDFLETRYRERIAILRELFPWDDPNYGIDEQWAVLYPHGVTIAAGETLNLEMRITNHSPVERTFTVTPHVPEDWKLTQPQVTLHLGPRLSGTVSIPVTASSASGQFLVTADVAGDGMEFVEWAEAVIMVK